MVTNYSEVTIKMNGEEFQLFKFLCQRFYSLLLVAPSVFNDFYDGLKNVDIDVASSLDVLHELINANVISDLEMTNFLCQLKDM